MDRELTFIGTTHGSEPTYLWRLDDRQYVAWVKYPTSDGKAWGASDHHRAVVLVRAWQADWMLAPEPIRTVLEEQCLALAIAGPEPTLKNTATRLDGSRIWP